jgi:hypothetical protein
MNIDGNSISIPVDDSEIVRVVCINVECDNHQLVHEYDHNYRQHTIALCGGCGGELHELSDGKDYKAGDKFRRVSLHNSLLRVHSPRIEGLTRAERDSGWEIQPMLGKVPPPEEA